MGIKLLVPPNAVCLGKVVNISIWPCLSGPFVPPEGYELASPVYLISPAFSFEQGVELTLHHFASLTTDSDCDSMVFVSSSTSPSAGESNLKYHFRVLGKGNFHKYSSTGTISLRHFCKIGVARKRCRLDQETEDDASRKTLKGESSSTPCLPI